MLSPTPHAGPTSRQVVADIEVGQAHGDHRHDGDRGSGHDDRLPGGLGLDADGPPADDADGGVPSRGDGRRLVQAARDAAASDAATADPGGHRLSQDLERLLTSAPVIEQSKGLLMGYYGMDDVAAYSLLRRWSSVTNIKLNRISEQLVGAAAQPAPQPFGALQSFLDSFATILLRYESDKGQPRVERGTPHRGAL
jgi:ANTAR domain